MINITMDAKVPRSAIQKSLQTLVLSQWLWCLVTTAVPGPTLAQPQPIRFRTESRSQSGVDAVLTSGFEFLEETIDVGRSGIVLGLIREVAVRQPNSLQQASRSRVLAFRLSPTFERLDLIEVETVGARISSCFELNADECGLEVQVERAGESVYELYSWSVSSGMTTRRSGRWRPLSELSSEVDMTVTRLTVSDFQEGDQFTVGIHGLTEVVNLTCHEVGLPLARRFPYAHTALGSQDGKSVIVTTTRPAQLREQTAEDVPVLQCIDTAKAQMRWTIVNETVNRALDGEVLFVGLALQERYHDHAWCVAQMKDSKLAYLFSISFDDGQIESTLKIPWLSRSGTESVVTVRPVVCEREGVLLRGRLGINGADAYDLRSWDSLEWATGEAVGVLPGGRVVDVAPAEVGIVDVRSGQREVVFRLP